ncbi:MAG: methyltransferase domain-containing protein [Bryobacter sp.]|nr:methyltransferase domain-containing protein [Bryobacter sp.]
MSLNRFLSIASLAILAWFLAGDAAWAQGKHPKSGRRIAPVMGVGGADWLERQERESEENPSKAIDLMKFKPGMVVADVGAGVGYYAFRIAEKVGPTGKVYATDIQPEMLQLLRRRMREKGVANVETVLSTEHDARLPENCCDVILMVDVYHELSQPVDVLGGLRKALKADGRLILLEYRKEDPYVPIRPEHKMSIKEAKMEVEAEGFRLDQVVHSLPWQHLLIFRKNEAPLSQR